MDPTAALNGEALSVTSFLLAFAAGVGTSFTPCVYPIIPITVTYIGARSVGSKMRAFVLSLFYTLGLATTYSALGAFAALTGKIFGSFTQSPYVYLVVGNIILLMGLGMLDVFSIPIPGFLQDPSVGKGRKGFTGAFLIGATSGFVAAPCTSPVLATILTYVSTKQSVAAGAGLLFVYSLGMCTLLIALGTFSGLLASLPKSGDWMVKIKKGFGWLMIGVGEFFIIRAGYFW